MDVRPLGGIGRHARLRILCRKVSGFESRSGHFVFQCTKRGMAIGIVPKSSVFCWCVLIAAGRRGRDPDRLEPQPFAALVENFRRSTCAAAGYSDFTCGEQTVEVANAACGL